MRKYEVKYDIGESVYIIITSMDEIDTLISIGIILGININSTDVVYKVEIRTGNFKQIIEDMIFSNTNDLLIKLKEIL